MKKVLSFILLFCMAVLIYGCSASKSVAATADSSESVAINSVHQDSTASASVIHSESSMSWEMQDVAVFYSIPESVASIAATDSVCRLHPPEATMPALVTIGKISASSSKSSYVSVSSDSICTKSSQISKLESSKTESVSNASAKKNSWPWIVVAVFLLFVVFFSACEIYRVKKS